MFEIRPDSLEWTQSLEDNLALFDSYPANLKEARKCFRSIIINELNLYQKELQQFAREIKILKKPLVKETSNIILTGHQAGIFHQGIARKYIETAKFAQKNNAIATHFILDLDYSDAGEFFYPDYKDSIPRISKATISSVSPETPAPIMQKVQFDDQGFKALIESKLGDTLKVEKVRYIYKNYDRENIIYVDSLIRAILFPELTIYEVPISRVFKNKYFQNLFKDLLLQYPTLINFYNKELEDFRRDRKISNPANPFPNLETGEYKEVPFWLNDLSSGKREKLYLANESLWTKNLSGEFTLASASDQKIITPRGAMTSLIFRLYCSDLFVHGLGGEKYDRFTDRFIETLLKINPPQYTVVSETKYLHPEALELKALEDSIAKLRKFYSHPELCQESYFPNDKIPDEFKQLISDKSKKLIQIQDTNTPAEKSLLAGELKLINNRIRELIDENIGNRWQARYEELVKNKDTYQFRKYPFFC